jgi:dolichyl-phosphate beta-glucosyltransferase
MPSMLSSALIHLSELASSRKRTAEILIVDDGSTDGTADAALKMASIHLRESIAKGAIDIRVVSLEQNQGKGGAVRHGMLHGRGKRFLMVDADGASRFEDLDVLWKAMDKMLPGDKTGDGEAVVVGSRAHLASAAVVKVNYLVTFQINMSDMYFFVYCSGRYCVTS